MICVFHKYDWNDGLLVADVTTKLGERLHKAEVWFFCKKYGARKITKIREIKPESVTEMLSW